jgi:hypothetical protein
MGNKIPGSWFDDPEWEMLRRKAEKRPIPKQLKQQIAAQRPQPKLRTEAPLAKASKQISEKEVVLNLKLRMPKVKLPVLRARRLLAKYLHPRRYERKHVLLVGVVLILVLGFGFKALSSGSKPPSGEQGPQTAKQKAEAAFTPLVPLDNLTDATGKQSKPEFRYDQQKKVLGFATTYNGTELTISQQQVPDKFESNPASLLSLAQSVNANQLLQTQKGTAYIGTDPKTNAQTAIFVTKEVLVFIRSEKRLDEDEWKFYINQLNPSK